MTAWQQASARQASLLAAGVAFYLFTSLFPAMIAAISLYGLFASPATVAHQTARISDLLPADAASLINGQLESLTSSNGTALSFGALLALLLAVYAASGGIGNLVTAINQMFGLADDRSFLRRKLLALELTGGALVFAAVAIGLLAVLPIVLDATDAIPGVQILAQFARWIVLVAAVLIAVGVLYRTAPNRPAHGRLVTTGVVLASALWLVASLAFTLYVTFFGNYAKTFGALAGVVVLILWLWVGIYAILIGAAVEAAREGIVTRDTVSADRAVAMDRTAAARDDTPTRTPV